MSISSHSDIHAADSLDSISLHSGSYELRILKILSSTKPVFGLFRNFLTSYEYESPKLNTFGGFQDFDGSGQAWSSAIKIFAGFFYSRGRVF